MLAPKTSPDSPITTVNSCGRGNGQPGGDGFNSQPSTPPRTFCNATVPSSQPYLGPAWNIRAGADHRHPSRGAGC